MTEAIILDVCYIFHQVAVEKAVKNAIDDTIRDGNERAVTVCKDGRTYSETGDTNRISGKILEKLYNSCNKEVILGFHTHPHNTGYPSINDIIENTSFKPEHDCVWGKEDNKIRCYKAKGKVAEIGEKKEEVYDEWVKLYKKYESSTGAKQEKYAQQIKEIKYKYEDLEIKQHDLIRREYNGREYPNITVTCSKPFIGRYIDIYEPNCPLDNILPKLKVIEKR